MYYQRKYQSMIVNLKLSNGAQFQIDNHNVVVKPKNFWSVQSLYPHKYKPYVLHRHFISQHNRMPYMDENEMVYTYQVQAILVYQ